MPSRLPLALFLALSTLLSSPTMSNSPASQTTSSPTHPSRQALAPSLTVKDASAADQEALDKAENLKCANEWVADMSLMMHEMIDLATADTGHSNDWYWLQFGQKGAEIKQTRNASGYNGFLRVETDAVNEDLPHGQKRTAVKVAADPETWRKWHALSREEQESYRDGHERWRTEKAVTPRATAKAAAQDATRVLNGIVKACIRLYQRTHVACTFFATKSTHDSSSLPFFWSSDKVEDFFPTAFKKSGIEIAGLLEGHALNGAVGLARHAMNASQRIVHDKGVIRELTFVSLSNATGIAVAELKKKRFSYKRLFYQVLSISLVKLVDYPLDKVQDPSELSSDNIKILLKDLRSGKCRFEKVTRDEFDEMEREMIHMKAAGLPPLPFHNDAQRKNTKHKQSAVVSDDEEEEEAPRKNSKRKRTTAKVVANRQDSEASADDADAEGEVDEEVVVVSRAKRTKTKHGSAANALDGQGRPKKSRARPKAKPASKIRRADAMVLNTPPVTSNSGNAVDGLQSQPPPPSLPLAISSLTLYNRPPLEDLRSQNQHHPCQQPLTPMLSIQPLALSLNPHPTVQGWAPSPIDPTATRLESSVEGSFPRGEIPTPTSYNDPNVSAPTSQPSMDPWTNNSTWDTHLVDPETMLVPGAADVLDKMDLSVYDDEEPPQLTSSQEKLVQTFYW